MEETRWKDISAHLKSKGIDTYAPAQHIGECTKEYVVVKDMGTTQLGEYSSTSNLYDIMCYVPRASYGRLESFRDLIKTHMKELETKLSIRPTHSETPSYYDEEKKGHMVSIQYRLVKKI